MKHIDEWIKEKTYGAHTEEEEYALAFFFTKSMDAISNIVMEPIMKEHKLFCMYKGKKYRVTGCSTMGDVWLHTDFTKDHSYTDRVDVELCSAWNRN